MKVYISWSGDKSRAVARALREFIPTVLQAVETFSSTDDIEPGTRWSSELQSTLTTIDVGLLCVTEDNMRSPWMAFEAGALSRVTPFVVPILVGLSPSDLLPPLTQFQALTLSRADMYQLLRLLNGRLDRALPDDTFERLFDHLWPLLERQVQSLPNAELQDEVRSPPNTQRVRTDHEILTEILELVRKLSLHHRSDDT